MKNVFYELLSQTEGHIEYFKELHHIRKYLEESLQDVFDEFCPCQRSDNYRIVQLKLTRDLLKDKKNGTDFAIQKLGKHNTSKLEVRRKHKMRLYLEVTAKSGEICY